MVEPIDSAWRAADGAILAGGLLLALLVGLRARKPADARDYYFGGRRLGWPAVGLSLAASEIGFAFALVAIPWTVYAPGGGFGCLQTFAIGGLFARWVVAAYVLPRFFERETHSPYEWVGARLGAGAQRLTTALFAFGALASQAARLYLSALVLVLVLDAPLAGVARRSGVSVDVLLVLLFGGLAWLAVARRGIGAAVLGDLPLFAAMLVAGFVALASLTSALDGGWELVHRIGIDSHKSDFWRFERSPAAGLSFWTAAIAGTWGGIGAYGADQLYVQRLLACARLRDARRALFLGMASLAVIVLASYVGVALFTWYERNPLPAAPEVLTVGHGERLFAFFLDELVPGGRQGWVVLGIAAAAVSASKALILALGHAADSCFRAARDARRGLLRARAFVLVAALAVVVTATALGKIAPRSGAVLALAYDLATYTRGALLAGLALALLRRPIGSTGLLWSAPIAVVFVAGLDWHGPRSNWITIAFGVGMLCAWLATRTIPALNAARPRLPVVGRAAALACALALLAWTNRYGLVLVDTGTRYRGEYDWFPIASDWYVPIGSTIAFVLGCLLARDEARAGDRHGTRTHPSTA